MNASKKLWTKNVEVSKKSFDNESKIFEKNEMAWDMTKKE